MNTTIESPPAGSADRGEDRSATAKLPAAVAGMMAGGLALAVGEFVASLFAPQPGPVTAVANRVVDEAPTWFVDFGKNLFGLADKPALVIGTILISLVIAAGFGVASRRQRTIGPVGIGELGIAGFGLVGLLSMSVDAQSTWSGAIGITLVAVAAGIAALRWLLGRAWHSPTDESSRQLPAGVTDMPTNPAVGRRSFVGAAGVVGAGAVVGGLASRSIRSRSSVEQARDAARDAIVPTTEITPPAAAAEVSAAEVSAVASTPGITPIVIPNDDFYRIDTALVIPQVDPTGWTLTIGGMVDREVTYTYEQLLERAQEIETVTLSCVSNEIGGNLVGNAVWQGIPLIELLDEVGILPGATQIKSTSVDGWDCGFPTDLAYDGRTALVAVGMNGEPLPARHGFPARLVVSGLYGYVSATKWLDSIELTTLEDFDGYWIPRGWSKLGPIKTQSRIDTPRFDADLSAGTIPIAGVAWAPNVGIDRVEIRIDAGPWMDATLGESLGINAWRQWLLPWQATSGRHRIQVRATDGSGLTQTEERTQVAPDGASGWHTVLVDIA